MMTMKTLTSNRVVDNPKFLAGASLSVKTAALVKGVHTPGHLYNRFESEVFYGSVTIKIQKQKGQDQEG